MNEILVKTANYENLTDFLTMHDFVVEELGDQVYSIKRDSELPVYMTLRENTMYLEVDLGDVSGLLDQEMMFKCLDLNTEILPVSIGINTDDESSKRLVLVESRIVTDLSDTEILSVFDAFELAVDKVESMLGAYVN